MFNRIVTFRRAHGVFKDQMKPYKSWYERVEMSPRLEVKGKFYRVLITRQYFGKHVINGIVICKDDGYLVRDERITKDVLKVFIYLLHLKVNKRMMKVDQKDDAKTRYRSLYEHLQRVIHAIEQYVTEDEKRSLQSHLHYYKNVSHWGKKTRLYAKQCLDYDKLLKHNKSKTLYSQDIQTLKTALYMRDQGRCRMFAELLENGVSTREAVRAILADKQYLRVIKNKRSIELVVEEINEAKAAYDRFVNDGVETWNYQKQYLNPNMGTFNLTDYIASLRKENTYDDVVQTNVNHFLQKFWLYNIAKVDQPSES